ncbi:BatA domain-containing protein [Polaribacter sp.]|uniref:BatA domain-containing protein n=1 Tax=Polaribacter sp. TaxID=1920175 RepID=UPI004047D3BE
MQFKNPEILYFFWILIIPILVHLFHLQKFVKVPFTNVAFLKKIIQDSRQSSRIKKWLILSIRMLLFLAILFIFSQPYFSNKNATKLQHFWIYLDNSLSMQARGEKGFLLPIAVNEIIESVPQQSTFTLLTNDNFHEEISYLEFKKTLLNIQNTAKIVDLNSVFLKINSISKNKIKTSNEIILISDFQYDYNNKFTNVTPSFTAIKLQESQKSNLSIDSIFISNNANQNLTISVVLKNQGASKDNVPIAIFNDEKLISKQLFSVGKDTLKTVTFSIQNQEKIKGKVEITFSDTFGFDNIFYFTVNSTKKSNVLAIGNETDFLSKIYTEDEFNLVQNTLQNVNYNILKKQQLIILYELENIPETLSNSLQVFSNNGGTVVIVPNSNSSIFSYNNFLQNLTSAKIDSKIIDNLKITNINFNHPFFQNVFSKKANNFQYPTVNQFFTFQSKNSSEIITFENNSPFLIQIKAANRSIYLFSSAINKKNSNLLNSPLIVPIFFNFGKFSFQHSQLYYYLEKENQIDVEIQLQKDEILEISNSNSTFIPSQQVFQNKVKITTKEQPSEAGFYNIQRKKEINEIIAFNMPKEESILQFLDISNLKDESNDINISSSISTAFQKMNKKNEVQWLWKWFLALAIVSLLLEILILKFYKS